MGGSKPKRAKTAASKRSKPTKAPTPAHHVPVIPESQPEPEDVSQSIEVEAELSDPLELAPPPAAAPAIQRVVSRAPSVPLPPLHPRGSARSASAAPLMPRPSARSGSAQPSGYAMPRERSGSVTSDAGWRRAGADPELRRQLAEVSRRYEDVSLKYQTLQELGRSDAESNFEKLRRATEQKARDAGDLIASLKKEVAELRKLSSAPSAGAGELAALQKQVAGLTAKTAALGSERDEAAAQSEQAKKDLQAALNENKALEARLVAARQQLSSSAAQEASNRSLGRSVGASASEELREMKMKESLYSDLTGLLVRSVKRKDGEDEYDCIQTGRNGTLHFHLTVANDTAHTNPQTPSGLSWEDAEFAYDPFLDEKRDHALLDLLPEYLTDGICFPRADAVKFYSKVLDSMTKRVVVEE